MRFVCVHKLCSMTTHLCIYVCVEVMRIIAQKLTTPPLTHIVNEKKWRLGVAKIYHRITRVVDTAWCCRFYYRMPSIRVHFKEIVWPSRCLLLLLISLLLLLPWFYFLLFCFYLVSSFTVHTSSNACTLAELSRTCFVFHFCSFVWQQNWIFTFSDTII